MIIRTNETSQLKDEFIKTRLDNMSKKDMRKYLYQIFSNDLLYTTRGELEAEISRTFSDEKLKQMLENVRTSAKKTEPT
tara:strand:- start:166 stop:402 length:237 start_codon:yes stop_codon:yes gene_type:complete